MQKLLVFFVSVLFSVKLFAQETKEKKKNYRDFLIIKTPAIQFAQPDDETLHEDPGTQSKRASEGVRFYFDPNKYERSIVEETDTNRVDPDDFSIVEVDEEYNPVVTDSLWVKIAEYYAIWDNKSVNPYGLDITKFTDSVRLVLFDSTLGRNWHPPLHNTYMTDNFGPRRYRYHYGIDLKLQTGDSVFVVWDGVVRIKKYDHGGYGNYVVVRHYNGLETVYGHLSRHLVEVGDILRAGDLVGWGGSTGRSTGPHLHFEIRYQGYAFDPDVIFDFRNKKIKYSEFILKPEHFEYIKQYRKVYFHRIKRGDTLAGIAAKYNVPIRQILKLNRMTMKTPLRVGQKLRIR